MNITVIFKPVSNSVEQSLGTYKIKRYIIIHDVICISDYWQNWNSYFQHLKMYSCLFNPISCQRGFWSPYPHGKLCHFDQKWAAGLKSSWQFVVKSWPRLDFIFFYNWLSKTMQKSNFKRPGQNFSCFLSNFHQLVV